jgi:hypothetical protein
MLLDEFGGQQRVIDRHERLVTAVPSKRHSDNAPDLWVWPGGALPGEAQPTRWVEHLEATGDEEFNA